MAVTMVIYIETVFVLHSKLQNLSEKCLNIKSAYCVSSTKQTVKTSRKKGPLFNLILLKRYSCVQ